LQYPPLATVPPLVGAICMSASASASMFTPEPVATMHMRMDSPAARCGDAKRLHVEPPVVQARHGNGAQPIDPDRCEVPGSRARACASTSASASARASAVSLKRPLDTNVYSTETLDADADAAAAAADAAAAAEVEAVLKDPPRLRRLPCALFTVVREGVVPRHNSKRLEDDFETTEASRLQAKARAAAKVKAEIAKWGPYIVDPPVPDTDLPRVVECALHCSAVQCSAVP
jgi:hypothetical protein